MNWILVFLAAANFFLIPLHISNAFMARRLGLSVTSHLAAMFVSVMIGTWCAASAFI